MHIRVLVAYIYVRSVSNGNSLFAGN